MMTLSIKLLVGFLLEEGRHWERSEELTAALYLYIPTKLESFHKFTWSSAAFMGTMFFGTSAAR
jgi:hypothetical protein